MQNFLIGRIRSKEKEFLTADIWSRLQESSGLSTWLAKLNETVYVKAATATTLDSFENTLHQGFAELKNDLFLNPESFTPLLWRKYDLHNFKILLKTTLSYRDLRKYLLPFGEYPIALVEKYLLGSEQGSLPKKVCVLLSRAQEVYKQTKSFQKMDEFLDDAYIAEMHNLSKKFSPAVQKYVLALEKTFKLKRQGLIEKNDLAGQEKQLDDNLTKLLDSAKYLNENILPALYFVRVKELEIKNLKLLYLRQAKQLPMLANYLRYANVGN